MEETKKYPKMALSLRRWRDAEHLTQEELSVKLGMSRNTYSSYEDGRARPRPKKGQAIAEYFGKVINNYSLLQIFRRRA